MSEVQWVVYYSDGDKLSNLDCEPHLLPRKPTLAVVQRNESLGREFCCSDWMIYHNDCGLWTFHDHSGMIAQIVHKTDKITCVLEGWFVADPKEWTEKLDYIRRDDNGLPYHAAFPPKFRKG